MTFREDIEEIKKDEMVKEELRKDDDNGNDGKIQQ